MRTLTNLAALSLSLILGLLPLAVIAVDDVVAAKAELVSVDAAHSAHAPGMEGR